MNTDFKFSAPIDYQERFESYYDAIRQLITKQAKISKASVAELAGRGRSAIKPSRDEYLLLITDIEAANEYVNNDPKKIKLEKLQQQKSELKDKANTWKERYSNLLAATVSVHAEMERLNTQLHNSGETQARLRQENSKLHNDNAELRKLLKEHHIQPHLINTS